MLTNYFKIAIRNLMKNKLFSFINISGMAIGLASCILIALFVRDELLFDRFHPEGDRTYRVYNISNQSDGTSRYLPIVPYPFASYMQKDFPEIESTLRMMDLYGEVLFEAKGKKLMEPDGLLPRLLPLTCLPLTVLPEIRRTRVHNSATMNNLCSLLAKYQGYSSALHPVRVGCCTTRQCPNCLRIGRHRRIDPDYRRPQLHQFVYRAGGKTNKGSWRPQSSWGTSQTAYSAVHCRVLVHYVCRPTARFIDRRNCPPRAQCVFRERTGAAAHTVPDRIYIPVLLPAWRRCGKLSRLLSLRL